MKKIYLSAITIVIAGLLITSVGARFTPTLEKGKTIEQPIADPIPQDQIDDIVEILRTKGLGDSRFKLAENVERITSPPQVEVQERAKPTVITAPTQQSDFAAAPLPRLRHDYDIKAQHPGLGDAGFDSGNVILAYDYYLFNYSAF